MCLYNDFIMMLIFYNLILENLGAQTFVQHQEPYKISLFMNGSQNFGISQKEIRKLQESIDKQLESSPLNKKMKASEIYSHEKPTKMNFIMQTSSIVPSQVIRRSYLPAKQQHKHQKVQKQAVSLKSQEQRKKQQKQFLISQNKNLKEQTLNLIQQLQGLLTVTKPKKYGINVTEEQQPKQLKVKKIIIASQFAKITQFQAKIAYEQRQLINVYDNENVTAQQAQIKILQAQLQKLQKERKGITNILKEQNKGIEQIQMSPQFRQKFDKTKEQLQKIKEQCKILQSKTLQNERLLRKKHQKAVGQHSKIKKLEKMIKQNNDKIRKGTNNEKVVTLQMISEIQLQIAELQEEKLISEKAWATKIANIEAELESRKLQEQKKMLIFKDKDKQVRLNDLRIKELKKLSMSQIGQKRKISFSGDEASKGENQNQGRKRNILFMQSSKRDKLIPNNKQIPDMETNNQVQLPEADNHQ